MTNKIMAVKSEVCKLGQVETKNQEFWAIKEELNEVTETQRDMEWVDKLHKEEQTQIKEEVKDVTIELVKCLET